MSNDIKFWVWRIAIVINLAISGLLIMKVAAAAFAGGKNTGWWVVAFFASVAISILLGFMYFLAKQKRWGRSVNLPDDLETLNNYVKFERKDIADKK